MVSDNLPQTPRSHLTSISLNLLSTEKSNVKKHRVLLLQDVLKLSSRGFQKKIDEMKLKKKKKNKNKQNNKTLASKKK